jgi:DNA-binding MarR family transcriptional regulator
MEEMPPAAQEDLGWALGVLLRAYRDRVAPALGDFPQGSRGYQTVTQALRTDRPSQLALAHHLGIDRTVMTYLLDDLEAAGLVERRPNPADRRQRQVVATSRAQDEIAALCARVTAAEDAVLTSLDDDERATLRDLLHKAAAALASAGAPACDEGSPAGVA